VRACEGACVHVCVRVRVFPGGGGAAALSAKAYLPTGDTLKRVHTVQQATMDTHVEHKLGNVVRRVLEGARGCSMQAKIPPLTLYKLSEHHMLVVEVGEWGQGNEELAGVGVASRVGHGQEARAVCQHVSSFQSINPRVLQTPHLLGSLHSTSGTRTVCQGEGFVVKRATVNGHACNTQRNKDPRRTRLRRAPFDTTTTPGSRLIKKAVDSS
jgi:hypothetical protein